MALKSVLTAALAALVLFCVPSLADGDMPMRLEPHGVPLTIERVGRTEPLVRYTLEIADTETKRSRGLMHRTDMPLDRAMLFVWPASAERFFWMANTPTPLDIIFSDEAGVIVHIAADTTPFSRQPIPSLRPARYALEVHAGQASDHGVAIGDVLRHPLIGK